MIICFKHKRKLANGGDGSMFCAVCPCENLEKPENLKRLNTLDPATWQGVIDDIFKPRGK